jgi:hypothetical protein
MRLMRRTGERTNVQNPKGRGTARNNPIRGERLRLCSTDDAVEVPSPSVMTTCTESLIDRWVAVSVDPISRRSDHRIYMRPSLIIHLSVPRFSEHGVKFTKHLKSASNLYIDGLPTETTRDTNKCQRILSKYLLVLLHLPH